MERRSRGRTPALVAASVVVLAALTAGTVLGAPSDDRAPGPHVSAPAAPSPSGRLPGPQSQDALFACPERHPVFTRHVPPIMDRAVQDEAVAWLQGTSGPGWSVAFLEPTRLGLFAFIDGDVEAARADLLKRGIAHVYRHHSGAELGRGPERKALVSQAMQRALEEPMRDVRRALRGLPADGELAYWTPAGAIFVQWKRPLPPAVAALAETYVDGALVVVEETAYAPREIRAGMRAILAAAERDEVPAQLSSGSACGDLSGVLVGVDPASLGDRGPDLQERLARIAGMPVHVIPQEAARAL